MSQSEPNRRPASRTVEALAFLSPIRKVLAWPGLYGWVGTAFALAGLWFLPTGLVLRSKAAGLKEPGPGAREAADGARHLGFGEVGPAETVTREGEKRWSAPFGFMAPSLRRERGEHDSKEGRPIYVVRDPLAGRSLVLAREGAEANARSSIVFGVFCLAVAGFWWGFRVLDPMTRGRGRAQKADEAGRSGAETG